MPPLRERGSDVELLARHFLALYAAEEGRSFIDFAPDALAALGRHSWPGNIRELQNVLRNVVLFHDDTVVSAAMLSRLEAAAPASPPPAPPLRLAASANGTRTTIKPLWQVEKQAIEAALAACAGNVPRAAALLEINPSTIYRRKAEWERAQLASSA
jgi:two-component system repressor protein LuxO